MKQSALNQNSRITNNERLLIIIAFIGILSSIIISYITSIDTVDVCYIVSSWISTLAYVLVINRINGVGKPYFRSKINVYVPYLLFILPATDFASLFYLRRAPVNIFSNHLETMYYIQYSLYVIVHVFVATIMIKQLKYINDLFYQIQASANDPLKSTETNNDLIDSFRIGHSIFDTVISSLLERANSSKKIISLSLIVMIAIVMIGGSASFGTVALNEARNIRDLENERMRMMEIVDALQSSPSRSNAQNKEVLNMISIKYGEDRAYKKVMENIERQLSVGWPDIAMRITIAALTLFLVQIFFHVYKYNQQQASHLLSKAEILELYKESGADQNELRSGFLSKIEANAKFEKTPSTPTEQFINIIGKGKDSA